MKVKQPVLESKIYAELLIHIGKDKVYATELRQRLIDKNKSVFGDIFGINKKTNVKSQVAIRKLLINLKDDNYLKETDKDDSGKKLDKNKRLFFIVWEKIVEDFIDYALSYYETHSEGKKYAELLKDLSKNKKLFSQNEIIQLMFKELFDFFARDNGEVETLSYSYKKLLDYDFFCRRAEENLFNEFLNCSSLIDAYDDGLVKFYQLIERDLGRKKTAEFKQFVDFLSDFPDISEKDYVESASIEVSQGITEALFGKARLDEGIKHEVGLIAKDSEEEPPRYPIRKEDLISNETVLKIVKGMESVLNEELSYPDKFFVKEEIPQKLVKDIRDLEKKFYWIRLRDDYYASYAKKENWCGGLEDNVKQIKKGDLADFDLIGSIYCLWIVELIDFYDLKLSTLKNKAWKNYMKYRMHDVKV